jgi:hypothetical protein
MVLAQWLSGVLAKITGIIRIIRYLFDGPDFLDLSLSLPFYIGIDTASVAMGKGDEQLDVRRTLGRRRSAWAGAWTGGDCQRRELGQAAIGVGRELGRAAGSAARMTGRAMTRTAAFGKKTGESFFFYRTGMVFFF